MRSGKGPVGVAGAYAGDWIFCERLVGGLRFWLGTGLNGSEIGMCYCVVWCG